MYVWVTVDAINWTQSTNSVGYYLFRYMTVWICMLKIFFLLFTSLSNIKGRFTHHCIPDYNTKGNFMEVRQWTGNRWDLWGENVPSAVCFLTCLTETEGWEHYSSVFTNIQNLPKTFGCA